MMFVSGAAELTLVVLGQCTSNVLAFQLQHAYYHLAMPSVIEHTFYFIFGRTNGQ